MATPDYIINTHFKMHYDSSTYFITVASQLQSMLWIGTGQLLLFFCVSLTTTAIPLQDFYDFGEEFGDQRDQHMGTNFVKSSFGSEEVYVSNNEEYKHSHIYVAR